MYFPLVHPMKYTLPVTPLQFQEIYQVLPLLYYNVLSESFIFEFQRYIFIEQ